MISLDLKASISKMRMRSIYRTGACKLKKDLLIHLRSALKPGTEEVNVCPGTTVTYKSVWTMARCDDKNLGLRTAVRDGIQYRQWDGIPFPDSLPGTRGEEETVMW